MQGTDSRRWDLVARLSFWTIGLLSAALMAYTTRHFINGDAIVYIEMGEAIRTGEWIRLANLTYSPGYPLLLGIAQALLNTNPMNEIQLLRVVNFICFILAMGACELVVSFVRKDLANRRREGEKPLPPTLVSALCYSMFLVAALVLVRIRLINPDMLVLAIVVTAAAIILWIRRNPLPYLKYVLLGIVTGFGYITKSFFFPFSPVIFALAGICSSSWKKAVPRVAVSVLAMLLVSAPLITALSERVGRFSYGELGRHVYALLISGKGVPVHQDILNPSPKVSRFVYGISCTRPSGFDICYWHEGFKPEYDLVAQAKVIPGNVLEIVTQTPWLLLILVWFAVEWKLGAARFGPIFPPSSFLLLAGLAFVGIAFYCLIRMEPRYIAPYLFVGFVGLAASLRCSEANGKALRRIAIASGALISIFLGLVAHAMVDQSIRGLTSSEAKPSYKEAFLENVTVKDFLVKKGINKDDYIGLVGDPPVYWGRMGGFRIVAEVDDLQQFLKSGTNDREKAEISMQLSGIRAVVAKDPALAALTSEGWLRVPGTRDFFVLFTDRR